MNEPQWAARYGFFQVPRVANGMAEDPAFLRAWGMVTEFERRFTLREHPGTVRVLAYLNRADMGSYAEALENPQRPANIIDTRQHHRLKYGFCLNAEYEVAHDIGVFARLGWNDGQSESWAYADVAKSALGRFEHQGWLSGAAGRTTRPDWLESSMAFRGCNRTYFARRRDSAFWRWR